VPADPNFEISIENTHILGGTRREIYLHMIHTPQVIIGINMMDHPEVNFSKERFELIKSKVLNILSYASYNQGKPCGDYVPVIPISGLKGDNVMTVSKNLLWWEGSSVTKLRRSSGDSGNVVIKTIREALEYFVVVPNRRISSGMRMPVFKWYPKNNTFTGYVIEGKLQIDDEITFIPPPKDEELPPKTNKIESLHIHRNSVSEAKAGDCDVGVSLVHKNSHKPTRGQVMMLKSDLLARYPCLEFNALIAVLPIRSVIKLGCMPFMAVHTALVPIRITNIRWKRLSSKKNAQMEQNPKELKSGEVGCVDIVPKKPVIVDRFDMCKKLGSFACFLSGRIAIVGKILDVQISARGGNKKSLRKLQTWEQIRLLFIGKNDKGSSLSMVPKEIISRIVWYMCSDL